MSSATYFKQYKATNSNLILNVKLYFYLYKALAKSVNPASPGKLG